ncbi:MAG: spondin domain-containing protein [Planctomycetota bacterium]
MRHTIAVCLLSLLLLPANVQAQSVQVTVENLAADDGFFFTPVWVGFHDGNFDLFDTGTAATPGLELIAEQGDFSVLSNEFAGSGTDGAVFGPAGFPGAPVIDPGETASAVFDINSDERYFSFASMIIPSNDAFIGNGDPTAYEVLDALGNVNDTIVIDLFAGDIYDSGTEVNDGQGAAFSAVGGTATDENGVVGLHLGLNNFLGTDTVAGTTIGSLPGSASPFARITISNAIPEPTSAGVFALLVSTALVSRRRSA